MLFSDWLFTWDMTISSLTLTFPYLLPNPLHPRLREAPEDLETYLLLLAKG